MGIGLLLIRLVVGLALAAHGAQKLFGAFGGHGIAGTGGFFESIGFRGGRFLAVTAGVGELAGGLAFALGLFTPFASAVLIASMLVAIFSVHLPHGFFAQEGGYEFPLIVGAVAAGVAFTGPGPLSLDWALGWSWWGITWGLIALGLGLIGALPPMMARSTSARAAHEGRADS